MSPAHRLHLAAAPSSRDVYRRIVLAVARHTTAARAPLVYAAWCAHQAVCYRAAGAERLYASHALAMRRNLSDALCLEPGFPLPALCQAIEALRLGELAAAADHLRQIESPAGLDRQAVTEGVRE